MRRNSYKENTIIKREDLRYLIVSHYNFFHFESLGEIVCHNSIADKLLFIFSQLYKYKYEIEKICLIDKYNADDDLSMKDNNSSAFNFRYINGTTKLSKHALGIAIDINPLYNPYVKVVNGQHIVQPPEAKIYANRLLNFPHKLHKNDICVEIFKSQGFIWGGDWKETKDYQHFEI